MKATGNGHWRELICELDLREKERKDQEGMNRTDESRYFRYRGSLYCMDDFVSVNSVWATGNHFKDMGLVM